MLTFTKMISHDVRADRSIDWRKFLSRNTLISVKGIDRSCIGKGQKLTLRVRPEVFGSTCDINRSRCDKCYQFMLVKRESSLL